MERAISLLGIIVFLGIAFLVSENKKRINWVTVFWGILLQFVFAVFILKTVVGNVIFDFARKAFDYITGFSDKGAAFVFGTLVNDYNVGAIFGFKVLPLIIFVSSLMGILYYLGIIQFFVVWGARLMKHTMKISGVEALSASLQVFMGIEANTAFKNYMKDVTRSELFVIMVTFMSTIASSVMAAYASFGAEPGHLLAASIMAAPAGVVIAKIMVPETETPLTTGKLEFKNDTTEHNVVEAAANGASLGLELALQIGAMLIAFVGLVWMINSFFGFFGLSFDKILGYVFAPFAFFMGIPASETLTVGKLLGTKTVFNEFLAYLQLKDHIAAHSLSPRTIAVTTYALCGFANFGSMAILIGGIGSINKEKRSVAASLGIKSILAGTLASFLTACVAGILL